MARRKIKIAVTGGIGAGKSEVCRIISESGYTVIHADDIAKDILKSDEDVRKEVRRRIRDLAPGGGFVLAAVHDIQPDVPPENVIAMFEAARGE